VHDDFFVTKYITVFAKWNTASKRIVTGYKKRKGILDVLHQLDYMYTLIYYTFSVLVRLLGFLVSLFSKQFYAKIIVSVFKIWTQI